MRIRNVRIFTVFFAILVLLAAYGLALLRTYVFKPPSSTASVSFALIQQNGLQLASLLRSMAGPR